MPKLTGWRRIASAMWGPPADPQIYGWQDIDATRALALIDKLRAAGHHVTPTHLVGRAIGRALEEVPDLNVHLIGTNAYPRPGIDVFFITAVSGGHDLTGVKVHDVHKLSAAEVAREVDKRKVELRQGRDKEFAKTKRTMEALPRPLLRLALKANVVLTEKLMLDVPPLALHKNPFGSAMITSVGMFGLSQGFAPLAWLYDVPLLVLIGEIVERPVVVDHQVVARPVIPITATIDHRYVDGWHVGRAMKAFRSYLENPEAYEPAV